MAYDPQRNRARAQPPTDQPAPVDMVLEGVAPVEAVPVLDVRQEPAAVTVEPVAAHAPVHGHEHGPDCDHDHAETADLRLIVAAGVATVAAAVLVLRRRRASRR